MVSCSRDNKISVFTLLISVPAFFRDVLAVNYTEILRKGYKSPNKKERKNRFCSENLAECPYFLPGLQIPCSIPK